MEPILALLLLSSPKPCDSSLLARATETFGLATKRNETFGALARIEAARLYTEFIAACGSEKERLDAFYMRAQVHFELGLFEEAALDFELVSKSQHPERCRALSWLLIALRSSPEYWVSKPLRDLPPPSPIPLSAESERAIGIAESMERHCAQAGGVLRALTLQAEVYLQHGQTDRLNQVLCRLAVEFADTHIGYAAAWKLAESRAVCPARAS